MKKIFTLLFAVGMVAVAQAQPGTREDRQFDQRNDQRIDQRIDQQNDQQFDLQFDQMEFDRGYDKGRVIVETNNFFEKGGRYNDRFYMEKKRDMMIARINQEYNFKVQKVRRSFYMTWFEKQRMIRFLENQRRWEIHMVYVKFNDYRNRDRFPGRGNRSNGHHY